MSAAWFKLVMPSQEQNPKLAGRRTIGDFSVLGWLRRTCPIEPGAKRWTDDRIGWLLGQFGEERLKDCCFVVPSREFFPDRYNNSERAARALFDRTCGFMGIDATVVELEFYQPTHRPGFARSLIRTPLEWAGQFQLRDGKNLVRVDVTLLPLPESLIAVYAHELAHQLLLGSQRICADDRDHELVTDLTTTFFGMGVFNANESLRNQYRIDRRGDEVGRMGYLAPENWAYALALCAWLRDERKPAWARWLRPQVRRVFQQSLAYLARTGAAELVDGGPLDENARIDLLQSDYPRRATSEVVQPNESEALGHEPDDDEAAGDESSDGLGSEPGLDGGSNAPPTRVDSVALLLEASQYVEAEEWEKANECLSDVIRHEPTNGTAYQQRALVLIELGMFPEALKDAEAAVRFEHDDSESYLARGAAYVEVGRFEEAIADLARYIKDVDEPVASGRHASRGFYLRGLAHAGLRNFSAAIKDYSRAINRWPDWPEPYEGRAEIYELIGNTKRAQADRAQAHRRATP